MAKKSFWLEILAMALVFGMTVVGCDNGSTGSTNEENVTFTSSTNNTVSNDEPTLGLIGTNASSNNTGVATAVIDSGKIKITSVAQGSATITVSDGTKIATIAITVSAAGTIRIGTITKYGSSGTNITYTVEVKPAGGTTDRIKFYFQGEVTDLKATEITLTNETGAVIKGTLEPFYTSPGEWMYDLNVTATQSGTIKVKVTKAGIETGEKTITVQAGG